MSLNSTIEHPMPSAQGEEQVCYEELGCFLNSYPFYDPVLRPIQSLPDSIDVINTKFFLTSKVNQEIPNEIDPKKDETIRYSTLSNGLNVKIIIHGFMDNIDGTNDWINRLTNAFHETEEVNVIFVDWGDTSNEYTRAVANSRVVGAQVAQLINVLNKTVSIPLSSIHLIGHSLGAHIAGYAGKRLNGTVGRITGLAPTGLYFDGLPEAIKLSKTDAQFVDVIHTDSMSGLSTNEPIGQLAFYPNGGRAQPYCALKGRLQKFKYNAVGKGGWNIGFCDIQQSVEFYIESIRNKQCTPIAYACADYKTYLTGQCNSCDPGYGCAVMGANVQQNYKFTKDMNSVKLFLKTGSELHHYCLRQYHLEIEMPAHPEGQYLSQVGDLSLTLFGTNAGTALDINGSHEFVYNKTNHLLATTSINDLMKILKLTVFWDNRHLPSKDHNNYRIFIISITVEPIWITHIQNRRNQTLKFCSRHPIEGIPMQTNTIFDLC